MATSIIDSWYYKDLFTSARMHAIFDDRARLQAWLDYEAALARAQARLGIVPQAAADEISEKAQVERLDLDAMKAEFDKVGFPIVPLVHQFAKILSPGSAHYLHWGSTTQDVTDTGAVLQLRNGLALLDEFLCELCRVLAKLAGEHRDTVMVGRTMQQQASPVTLGYKLAVWLAESMRHRQRLEQLRPRVLVSQVAGAAGTIATLGGDGLAVRRETARELALGEASITWHVARDAMTETALAVAMVGATTAKIGQEIALLMRTEVGELSEPFEAGRGASSTLPQKRNPILCQPLIAAGHMLREKAALALDAMLAEHERGAGAMHLEWSILPEAFVIVGGALENAIAILDGLVVDRERMRDNLELLRGLIMSEAVMMGLAPALGRNRAHDAVYAAAASVADGEHASLRDALLAHREIASHLSAHAIDALLDPASYVGAAPQMVDQVLRDWQLMAGES